MGFRWTCAHHLGWEATDLVGAYLHVDNEHPGTDWMTLRDTGIIGCVHERQEEGRGKTHWIFVCRGCNVTVDRTTEPPDAYCDGCRAKKIMEAHGG